MRMFDEFENVTVREETIPEKFDLEKVLDVEERIIEQYKNDDRLKKSSRQRHLAYQSIYETAQEKLADVTITSELLQEYIDARENTEENSEALIRGMYSAVFLDIIYTTKQTAQINLDGKGKTFNYLFCYVKNARNVTLQNIKGDHILTYAGIDEGHLDHIKLQNIKGHHLLAVAGLNGKIEHIHLDNITGSDTLYMAGREKGSVKYAVLHNVNGDNTLKGAGIQGNLKQITLQNIIGHGTLYSACANGDAKHITLQNITGIHTFFEAGGYNGLVEYAIFNEIKGRNALCYAGKEGKIEKIALMNVRGKGLLLYAGSNEGCVENILKGNALTKKQKKLFTQISALTKKIHLLSFEDQKIAHDEIAKLQEEIFSEVP